ncbi:ME1 [Symbiodinium sp. CCMP2592]|nr:ME1 [Symbiodinium sp. CCMP2592]
MEASCGGSCEVKRLHRVRLSLVFAVVSISRRYPGSVEMAAKALADLMADEDPSVRRKATAGLAEIDMRRLQFPRRALLLPLLRALSDKDPQTRRAAAEALSEKAAELTKLPILLTHGWGQDAGRFPALRTAGGDEVDALLSEVLQNSVDFWCFKSAVALSLALSGSSKSKDAKVWDVLLDPSWAAALRMSMSSCCVHLLHYAAYCSCAAIWLMPSIPRAMQSKPHHEQEFCRGKCETRSPPPAFLVASCTASQAPSFLQRQLRIRPL